MAMPTVEITVKEMLPRDEAKRAVYKLLEKEECPYHFVFSSSSNDYISVCHESNSSTITVLCSVERTRSFTPDGFFASML